ncbi:lytic transglycosylase domain-containing protein [Roseospira navarrensis]|uniref:Transglycosylase SLT domain-containing protein n=1 Tax=Roseospira navarrensis TaxID=140058 RepID=A0A7X1ZDQ6_9PROT|nr:lytic transglycosylase domain-containing protein [Roseospira navarrensis]MQX36674.1 transglycosylase SLT domain-containing protein [Roseospira navarrensis]
MVPILTPTLERPAPGRLPAFLALVVAALCALIAAMPVRAEPIPRAGALGQALDALDERAFDVALAHSGRLTDPVARTIIQWAVLKEGLGSFETIAQFLQAHPDWPHTHALRRSAERAITGHEPPARVVAWFETYPPLTTDGMVAHAQALRAAGRSAESTEAARRAWVNGRFSRPEATAFLRRFESVIRPRDHEARLSELLWDEAISEAERLIPLVDPGHQALARARIRLMTNAGGVDAAIDAVPSGLSDDPGLVYDRLVWRWDRDLFERSVSLLTHPSANQGRPQAWDRLRARIGREALERGHVSRAYAIFANHGQDSGIGFATGEWMAGWIMLRFLRDPARALPHFETMHAGVSYPQSLSRAAYWAGRAAAAAGRVEPARRWYEQAAVHAETFYGQLAIEALGERLADHLETRPTITDADRARFATDDRVQALRLLTEAGRTDWALPFALALNDEAATPGFRVLVADDLSETDRPDLAVFFARRAALAGTMLPVTGYPVPPEVLATLRQSPGTGPRPEPALMLSLIRQESNFNTQAVSRAGARGLMQLMPRTAQHVAQTLGESSSNIRLTTDPAHNARLGTAYFASLLEDFRGSYVLAIAGYNAGPHRSVRWMRVNGDPRRMSPEEVVDWIEKIPFSETRNYVQRVLEGTQVYRHRLGETPAADALSRDLQR